MFGNNIKTKQSIYFLNTNLKEYMHLYVHCSIVYISQCVEETPVLKLTNADIGTKKWGTAKCFHGESEAEPHGLLRVSLWSGDFVTSLSLGWLFLPKDPFQATSRRVGSPLFTDFCLGTCKEAYTKGVWA